MKSDFTEDIKEGIYVGGIAGAAASLYYGIDKSVFFLQRYQLPVYQYIGMASGIGTMLTNIFIEEDGSFAAAVVSGFLTIAANKMVDSPVTPLIVATVAAPAHLLRQKIKN